jgi:hypothetical protein
MQGPEIMIPLTIFGGSAVVAYRYFDGRHKERMAMIEKGVSAAELKSASSPGTWKTHPLTNLKWGLVFLFVGAAILVANLLHETYRLDEAAVYWSAILVAGGVALVLFYVIANAKLKKEGSES